MLRKINQGNDESQIQQGQEVSEHQESSQFVKVKHAGRKNFCQICHNVLAKYTCPKCELKTCSLQCTRKHKDIKNCSGQRQSTQYLSKDQITPQAVQKDYNFIEDMISGADRVKKVLSGVNNTINLEPRRFKILRNNAKQLYNIKLSNGPNILERHRDNISFFFVKTKSIYWVFELLYFEGKGPTGSNQSIKTSRVLTQPISDQKTFIELLPEDYLNKTLLETKKINTTKRQEFLVFLQNKQRINQSSNSNNAELKKRQNVVLSRKLGTGKFITFYELIEFDTQKKINQQLTNISLFEFPTLYVVHKSLRNEFIETYEQTRFKRKQNSDQKGKNNRIRRRERSRSRQKNRKQKQKRSQSQQGEQQSDN